MLQHLHPAAVPGAEQSSTLLRAKAKSQMDYAHLRQKQLRLAC